MTRGPAPREIQTARLMLSAPAAEHADLIFTRYASDHEVTRFLGWPTHRSVSDTKAFLAFSDRQWAETGVGPYLIHARADGTLLGSTGLTLVPADGAVTGYVLAKDAWGRGYATEALRAMVDVAGGIGVTRLIALCHVTHRASQRVLEKCGFQRDPAWGEPMAFPNLLPGEPQDGVCYERVAIEQGARW